MCYFKLFTYVISYKTNKNIYESIITFYNAYKYINV